MLRRGQPKSTAGHVNRATLTPVAEELGLDYNHASITPPLTPEAVTLEAFRCGSELLMASRYPDGWPEEEHRKEARKAAKLVEARLLGCQAQEAVSHMASGYGRAMAELWRHAASRDEHADRAADLLESAARSDELADRVRDTLPVTDPWSVLADVASAARMRFVPPELDGPNGHAVRARVNGEAQALALGPHYRELEIVVIEPVMSLDLRLNAAMLSDWAYIADFWRNAISDEPLSYVEFSQLVQEDRAGG